MSEFIITLAMAMLLSVGDYNEREAYTHRLKLSSVSFAQLHMVRGYIDDPETCIRLKDVAYYKWCIETDDKYRDADYYGADATVNVALQLEHFKKEWK
jgi:hypothetical protein